MGGKGTNAGPNTDPIDHSPERLLTRRLLRVLPPSLALVLRHPLFDFDDKDVILELWGELPEQHAELEQHVGIEREPLPVMPFPSDSGAASQQVDVTPSTSEYF
ncbi:MAG: hypothetical protein A2Y55_02675 [Actinobacteria bacterium RBG_16_68_12]|nr:MAG: hypothetical protein A2Y55_02675 [Actinobacteria bacterium RBG_16_68_12]